MEAEYDFAAITEQMGRFEDGYDANTDAICVHCYIFIFQANTRGFGHRGSQRLMSVDRMDHGELQMVREYLGLTIEAFAAILSVNPRTIRSWEAGRDPIPERIRVEVGAIVQHTAEAVCALVTALREASDASVRVYRRDEDMHAARPDTTHLPARWWRHVVARACEKVPGVVVISD